MKEVSEQDILNYNIKIDTMGVWVSAILSTVLCIGGISLLIYNPPVWGQVLGIPYTIGGFGLAILSFDRANRPRADSQLDRQDLEDEKNFLSKTKLKK